MKAYKVIALSYSEDGYPRGWYTVGYYMTNTKAQRAVDEEVRKWGKEASPEVIKIEIEEGE